METIKREDIPRAGILNTRNYLYAPDGDQYMAFWCEEWSLVSDKEFPIPIRAADRWCVIAYQGNEIAAVIPGCEVTGFTVCYKPPMTKGVFTFWPPKGIKVWR